MPTPSLRKRIEAKFVEVTERIVIDYANLSGRESANRGEFRKETLEHLRPFFFSTLADTLKELQIEANEMRREKCDELHTTQPEIMQHNEDIVYNQALSDIHKLLDKYLENINSKK